MPTSSTLTRKLRRSPCSVAMNGSGSEAKRLRFDGGNLAELWSGEGYDYGFILSKNGCTGKEVQPSQTFQPPARPVVVSEPPATPTTPALDRAASPGRDEPQTDSPRRTRASRATGLDSSKLRTTDLMRRVDTSGDGEVSRSELRKGLYDVLGPPGDVVSVVPTRYTCSNDDFKELMRALDADGSDSISVKDLTF
eukprot:Skav203114  [mRNA]  locus=scaffold447:502807:506946:+ [translate_table: standard]